MTIAKNAIAKPSVRPLRNQALGGKCLLKSFLYVALTVLATLAYYAASGHAGSETVQWLAANQPQQFDTHKFQTVVVSNHPLIVVLENFLTQSEATHIEHLAQDRRNRSHRGETTVPSWRKSMKASIPTKDPIVQRVMLRASRLQGFVATENIQMQVVRYATGQQEKPHYDQSHRELPGKIPRRHQRMKARQVPGTRHKGESWQEDEKEMMGHGHKRDHHTRPHRHEHRKQLLKPPGEESDSRVGCRDHGVDTKGRPEWEATLSVILKAKCGDRCGTQFPKLRTDWSAVDSRLCDIIECDQQVLTIKAKPGNAIFWKNTNPDGSRDDSTLHANLPVTNGTKVVLNTFGPSTGCQMYR